MPTLPVNLRVLIAVALGLAIAAPIRAAGSERQSPRFMTADSIRQEFAGKPLAGVYPSGKRWREFIFSDGTTDYHESSSVRRPGKWWLTTLEFCFSYPPPGLGGCFRVVKVSSNCYELFDYGGPLGRSDAPEPRKGFWNGRMWRSDVASTCEESPSV
jgi:hypothetical protein